MTTNIIPVDIYKRGIAIVSGTDVELRKWLDENGFQDSLLEMGENDWNWENTDAITTDNGVDVAILSIKPMTDEIAVHELSHAAFNILRMVGIDPAFSEESYAYLLDYLFRKWKEITNKNN